MRKALPGGAGQPSLRIVSSPTLRQQIVERLTEAIELGELPPGSRLIDRELCERLGVSRSSLREALRELEASGLITTQPHRGPIVALVTPEMARSIYEIRAVLEALAARLFARRASTGQIEELEAAVDRLAEVYSDYNPQAFLKAKGNFYRILLEGGGNEIAADMLRTIHTRVSQLRVTSMSSPSRAKESIAEIRELVKALKSRNEEAAWHTCVRHVENAAEAALGVLGRPQSSGDDAGSKERAKVAKNKGGTPRTKVRAP
jgi:DNA-binding GntR family transcriptional regulator